MGHIHFPRNSGLERFVASVTCDDLGSVQPEIEWGRLHDGLYRLTLTFRLEETVRQDDWRLTFKPAFSPSFHWAPHLTPTDSHVIDQHCFRSPAVIFKDDCRLLAVIPDLGLLPGEAQARWYLDNDAGRCEIILGMSNSRVKEHVLFERAPGASYAAGETVVGCYVMVADDPEVLFNPWRPVLDFLWKGWGTKLLQAGEPLDTALEPFVRHAYRWAFEYWEPQVWQQFELDGKEVGAAAFIVNVTQSPGYPGPVNEREVRSVWNQAWFSSLRSASGMYRFGAQTGDDKLITRARLSKELALSAPQREGLFPSVIATEMTRLEAEGITVNRSQGWDTAYWGNSNRNPRRDGSIKCAPYHIADMSWTALWMLRWYEELEQDSRLLSYAVRYGEALLRLQDAKGYYPAWLDALSLEPLEELRESPETAVSVTFLLKLHELTGEKRYADSALKAADIVAEEIVPIGRWEDFETYWSCSGYGLEHLGAKFVRNAMYKQCNLSMFWTAEAFLGCWRMTGDQGYLRLGERCLDELLMTQASWQPPYIYVRALGGFGVMNADGEWNDARQSLFAELLIEYGHVLKRTEYIERGIAAIKCAFVMMYCPENPGTKEQWEKAYPFFGERDYGFMMENYGHGGEADGEGLGMGEFTIFDWGNGAAAESYLRLKAHYPALNL